MSWNAGGYAKFTYPSDGQRSWLEFSDNSAVDPDLYTDFTITYWVNKGNYFGHFGNTSQAGLDGVFIANSASLFSYRCSSPALISFGFPSATWVFVAYAYNSTGDVKMYGSNTGTWDTDTFTPGCSNTRNIAIGGEYYGRAGTHYMDDVRMFSTYMSDAEIIDIKNEGRQ